MACRGLESPVTLRPGLSAGLLWAWTMEVPQPGVVRGRIGAKPYRANRPWPFGPAMRS